MLHLEITSRGTYEKADRLIADAEMYLGALKDEAVSFSYNGEELTLSLSELLFVIHLFLHNNYTKGWALDDYDKSHELN